MIDLQVNARLDSRNVTPPLGVRHTQPLSVTAQFLRQTDPGPAEVHVTVVHTRPSATQLQARLFHHTSSSDVGECTIEAQAVFILPDPPASPLERHPSGALALGAAQTATSPMLTHPSQVKLDKDLEFEGSDQRFTKKTVLGMVRAGLFDWAVDPAIEERRLGRVAGPKERVLEAGVWCAMRCKEDVLDYAVLG